MVVDDEWPHSADGALVAEAVLALELKCVLISHGFTAVLDFIAEADGAVVVQQLETIVILLGDVGL